VKFELMIELETKFENQIEGEELFYLISCGVGFPCFGC
jgi:hypothetical protein